MANQRRKPADQLQGWGSRYKAGGLRLVKAVESRPVPPVPAGTQPNARKRWRLFWTSPMSTAVDLRSDSEAIYRWLHCVSEREALQALVDDAPLVQRGRGMVANPLYPVIAQYSREIARYEDHFGMTAMARWRLGITAVEHETAVAELRERREPVAVPRVVNLDGGE